MRYTITKKIVYYGKHNRNVINSYTVLTIHVGLYELYVTFYRCTYLICLSYVEL